MTTLTPLETQLLAALKLRRATSWPFVPPERGGLGLTAETAGGITEHQERNRVADEAVERAIAAAEGVVTAAIEAPDLYVASRGDGRTQACMEIMAKDLAKIPLRIIDIDSGRDERGTAVRFGVGSFQRKPLVYVLTVGSKYSFYATATMTYPAGTPTCQARAENDFRKAGCIVTNRNVKSEMHAKRLKGYMGRISTCVSLTPDTTP